MKDRKGTKERRERLRNRPAKTKPPPSVIPARDQALVLPELLEEILFYLDQNTLLVSAQRVCRAWYMVITSSPRLQQMLFLAPMVQAPAGSAPLLNPLLMKAFGPLFSRGDRMSMKTLIGATLPITDMKQGRRRHLAFIHPEASWRRMLVSHPAPRRIGHCREVYQLQQHRVRERRSLWQVIDVPDQLRMGQLYDLVDAILWGDATPAHGTHSIRIYDPPGLEYSHHEEQSPAIWKWSVPWTDSVDLIINEDAALPDPNPEFPPPREKCLSSAWAFRSKGFAAPVLNFVPRDWSRE